MADDHSHGGIGSGVITHSEYAAWLAAEQAKADAHRAKLEAERALAEDLPVVKVLAAGSGNATIEWEPANTAKSYSVRVRPHKSFTEPVLFIPKPRPSKWGPMPYQGPGLLMSWTGVESDHQRVRPVVLNRRSPFNPSDVIDIVVVADPGQRVSPVVTVDLRSGRVLTPAVKPPLAEKIKARVAVATGSTPKPLPEPVSDHPPIPVEQAQPEPAVQPAGPAPDPETPVGGGADSPPDKPQPPIQSAQAESAPKPAAEPKARQNPEKRRLRRKKRRLGFKRVV